MDLQAVREIAAEIARDAGATLMRYFDQPHQQRTKKTPTDIVTEGDTASEAVIVAGLQAAFPDQHIIGEEGGGMGASAETAAYFWHVDPLDGTSNYASNIPFFSVSMGMADRYMRPLVGVVYNPVSGELFSAARGYGATVNQRPIQVSSTDTLINAVLATGFPYDVSSNPDNNFREWTAFMLRTRAVRRFGSAALELAFVAAGRFDGFWEARIHSWDAMAGALLVEEAGGQITDYDGQQSDRLYQGQQVVASNGLIHNPMLALLDEAINHQPSGVSS